MASVWVPVWLHGTDMFTAKTKTVPKFPPECALDSGGKHVFPIMSEYFLELVIQTNV